MNQTDIIFLLCGFIILFVGLIGPRFGMDDFYRKRFIRAGIATVVIVIVMHFLGI